jgi:hypothetical protein
LRAAAMIHPPISNESRYITGKLAQQIRQKH